MVSHEAVCRTCGLSCIHSDELEKVRFLRLAETSANLSQKACVICGSTESRKVIPEFARTQLILSHLFVPKGGRCCAAHLNGQLLVEGTVVTHHPPGQEKATLLSGRHALDALVAALNTLEAVLTIKARLNPDDSKRDPRGLADEEYKLWTGWCKKSLIA